LVSVIIVVYNGEKYIEEAIQVFKSNLQKYELIVVDDGSTDSTRKIVEKYKDVDIFIKKIERRCS
jgi:glycosyltransferase involved in cell wall biosynthesis